MTKNRLKLIQVQAVVAKIQVYFLKSCPQLMDFLQN